MKISYQTRGICARRSDIEVENGTVQDVQFIGGCNGNTKGISSLVKGMKVEEVIAKLKDIECGSKGTSCPAQLAKALQDNFT